MFASKSALLRCTAPYCGCALTGAAPRPAPRPGARPVACCVAGGGGWPGFEPERAEPYPSRGTADTAPARERLTRMLTRRPAGPVTVGTSESWGPSGATVRRAAPAQRARREASGGARRNAAWFGAAERTLRARRPHGARTAQAERPHGPARRRHGERGRWRCAARFAHGALLRLVAACCGLLRLVAACSRTVLGGSRTVRHDASACWWRSNYCERKFACMRIFAHTHLQAQPSRRAAPRRTAARPKPRAAPRRAV